MVFVRPFLLLLGLAVAVPFLVGCGGSGDVTSQELPKHVEEFVPPREFKSQDSGEQSGGETQNN